MRYLSIIVLFFLSTHAYTNNSFVDYNSVCQENNFPFVTGSTLCVPGTVISQAVYKIALRLSPTGSFDLISADTSSLPENTATNAFFAATGLLSFPVIQIGNQHYSAVMNLVSLQPTISFVLKSYNETVQPGQNNSPVQNMVLNYRVLVEYFEYLTPEQIANIFKSLDSTQLLILGIYNPFGNLVHYYACQSDPNILFNDGAGTITNCTQQAYSWAQTAQYTNDPASYAMSKRNSLLISIKCSTGEIDKASCNMYTNTATSYMNSVHQTNMEIIKNIGGNCYVGEPDCVP